MMDSSGRHFLGLVALFFNSSVINNLTNYEPLELPASYLFFNNLSDPTSIPKPVEEDPLFDNSTFFSKCCPPSLLYEIENRECVKSTSTRPIYEELNITVNLIQSGLLECTVLLDRFVKKENLRRFEGNASLTFGNEVFPNRRYCLDKTVQNDENYVVRLCQEKEYCTGDDENGTKDWCVHKCCEDGYGLENYKCTFTDRSGIRVKNNSKVYERTDGYAVMYGPHLDCSVTNWKEFQQVEISVKANGSMYEGKDTREYKINDYCMATNYDTHTGRLTDMIVFCEFRHTLYIKWVLMRIAVILTCICFVLTLAVYVFVYKLKKMVEKIIACFCLVNLIFWLMFTLRIFYVNFGDFCINFAYIYFFITVSRLSWLNVLSYEIWRTIGSIRASLHQTKEFLRKQMIYYSVYAIIVPAIAMLFFILGNREEYPLPENLVPLVNKASCFIDVRGLDGNYGQIHLYIPVSILIIINIVFYVKTLRYYIQTKRDLKKISNTNTKKDKMKKSNNKKGFMILKLGLIMGLTWIYYLYAYLSSFKDNEILENIGDVLSFANILEGVYFFVIFVVKWKVVKEIMYKANIIKRETATSTSESSTTTVKSNVSIETTCGMAMETIQQQTQN